MHCGDGALRTHCCVPEQAIARLGRLMMLNASAVSAHERRDSELRYMRGVLGAHIRLAESLHSMSVCHHAPLEVAGAMQVSSWCRRGLWHLMSCWLRLHSCLLYGCCPV